MLPFLPPFLPIAQAAPQVILDPQEVRPLSGQLDNVPVFNSNSPEVVQTEGILLSTFPPVGKAVPSAHLNFPFPPGRFDVFAHHISKAPPPDDLRTLYIGVLVHNPGQKTITIDVLEAASYLSQPDAPFYDTHFFADNAKGDVYVGPGDRAMNDILRGKRQDNWPAQVIIPPGESRMLMNLPIPVSTLTPPLNGRSTLARLRTDGTIYLASLSLYARLNSDGTERAPNLAEWEKLLQTAGVAGPRDVVPTPPDLTEGAFEYSRVAGVARGSRWTALLTDNAKTTDLAIPAAGKSYSYGLSTLQYGRMGTGQNQTAILHVRYPDTAYAAHGNYGIQYSLTLPLYNPTDQKQTVTVAVQNPIKEDKTQGGLKFFEPLPEDVFFRGTVRLRYKDDQGLPAVRYAHLIMRRGQRGEPIITLNMPPGDRRLVTFDFLYPPDATPPQMLTVKTLP